MKNRIITISREFGSGGRTIGKTVATELGIPCYDRELLQQIAAESGFDENYIKDAGEYAPGDFWFPRFRITPADPTTRIIFGRSNTGSSPSWHKKVPASS